jgi:hypothetical protein
MLEIGKDPGRKAGAGPIPGLDKRPEPRIRHPWHHPRQKYPCSLKRCFSPLAQPDQTATALPRLKLALLESRLTFEMGGIDDRTITASF